MKNRNPWQSFLFVVIILSLFVLSSCADGQGIGSLFASPTATTTQTATPTLTPSPTPTLTPTLSLAERPIDMEVFHTLPPSYEYLLAHLNEFIQAPDPVSEREAFDQWLYQRLLPAIGPRETRQVNLPVDALGTGPVNCDAWPNVRTPFEGEVGFFYFEYSGQVFPVVVFNVSRFDPAVADATFAVALFDIPGQPGGTNALQRLAEGGSVAQTDIWLSPSAELLSGIDDIGDIPISFMNSVADTWVGCDANFYFGLGLIWVIP